MKKITIETKYKKYTTYHVDMILSEPSGMEQYIDPSIAGGHYAHSFVGCTLEVVMSL